MHAPSAKCPSATEGLLQVELSSLLRRAVALYVRAPPTRADCFYEFPDGTQIPNDWPKLSYQPLVGAEVSISDMSRLALASDLPLFGQFPC